MAICFPVGLTLSSFQITDEYFLSMDVEGTERSCLVKLSHGYDKQLPLIIVLHENDTSPLRLAAMNWQKFDHRAVIAFPTGRDWRWSCQVGKRAKNDVDNDILFIERLIAKLHKEFLVDISRTFIVGAGNSFCLAEQFQQRSPAIQAVQWREKRHNYSSNDLDRFALPMSLPNTDNSKNISGEVTRESEPDTLHRADPDFIHLKYQISPLSNQGLKGTIKTIDFSLKYPIANKSKYRILGRSGYEALWTKKEIFFNVGLLQSISSQLVFIGDIGKSTVTAFAGTGIYSDFKDVTGKDFRFSSGVRFKRKVSDRFGFSYGLSYNRQFFGNQVIPFVEIDYWISDRIRIFGPFPVRPKIEMSVAPTMVIGAGIQGDGSSYRLSSGYDQNQVVQINQWGINLYVRKKMYNAISLYASAGRFLRRSLKLYNDSDQVPWTIITIPLGSKAVPVERINNSSNTLEVGLSYGF